MNARDKACKEAKKLHTVGISSYAFNLGWEAAINEVLKMNEGGGKIVFNTFIKTIEELK